MSGLFCYYRFSQIQGLPFDYFLWQNGQLCQGKESAETCSPKPPTILNSKADLQAVESSKPKPLLQRLPADEGELEAFLLQAEKSGQITWVSPDNVEVYQMIQGEIDSAAPDQDVHLVFGTGHLIEGQTAFINELITTGQDRQQLNGVTHLALEYERVSRSGYSVQEMMDRFLIFGQPIVRLSVPEDFMRTMGVNEPAGEMADKSETFEIAYEECYNVVMADAPSGVGAQGRQTLGSFYSMVMRENYAVRSVAQRVVSGIKDVVVWNWGATHAEKYRLPHQIAIEDPKAKVVSIVINGGTYVDALAFDRVVARLGWRERSFVIKLAGYRDADYVIHLPTRGRALMKGINRNPNPVLQQIYDQPQ